MIENLANASVTQNSWHARSKRLYHFTMLKWKCFHTKLQWPVNLSSQLIAIQLVTRSWTSRCFVPLVYKYTLYTYQTAKNRMSLAYTIMVGGIQWTELLCCLLRRWCFIVIEFFNLSPFYLHFTFWWILQHAQTCDSTWLNIHQIMLKFIRVHFAVELNVTELSNFRLFRSECVCLHKEPYWFVILVSWFLTCVSWARS